MKALQASTDAFGLPVVSWIEPQQVWRWRGPKVTQRQARCFIRWWESDSPNLCVSWKGFNGRVEPWPYLSCPLLGVSGVEVTSSSGRAVWGSPLHGVGAVLWETVPMWEVALVATADGAAADTLSRLRISRSVAGADAAASLAALIEARFVRQRADIIAQCAEVAQRTGMGMYA